MIKRFQKVVLFTIIISIFISIPSFAWEGYNGYEGGISSGYNENNQTMEYQEVCFLTGEPVLFKGTLVLKKSAIKNGVTTSTYTYKLTNTDKSATLNRVLVFSTKITEKENGQKVEETSFAKGKIPSETVVIDGDTYKLTSYEFTKSNIVDSKPTINYFAGNIHGIKTFSISTNDLDKVKVEMTGETYGYDQFWGTSEVQKLKYNYDVIKNGGDGEEKWGGNVEVVVSSNMDKEYQYFDNDPEQIAFDGGYVLDQSNTTILEYNSKFIEFDQNGRATNNIIQKNNSYKIEGFPSKTRLAVANLNHLRGHWSEEYIKVLYGLEVFTESLEPSSKFNPEEYITRSEFTAALSKAAEEVPVDPAFVTKATAVRGRNRTAEVSPFVDVDTDNKFYPGIKNAFTRGLISGRGENRFEPDKYITLAEALTIFVRALGLQNLAPNPVAVTTFKDNDKIPSYARNAAYVSQRIGLIQGDDKGYLNPNSNLTKARTAALLNRFIDYLREDIIKDYRERALNF